MSCPYYSPVYIPAQYLPPKYLKPGLDVECLGGDGTPSVTLPPPANSELNVWFDGTEPIKSPGNTVATFSRAPNDYGRLIGDVLYYPPDGRDMGVDHLIRIINLIPSPNNLQDGSWTTGFATTVMTPSMVSMGASSSNLNTEINLPPGCIFILSFDALKMGSNGPLNVTAGIGISNVQSTRPVMMTGTERRYAVTGMSNFQGLSTTINFSNGISGMATYIIRNVMLEVCEYRIRDNVDNVNNLIQSSFDIRANPWGTYGSGYILKANSRDVTLGSYKMLFQYILPPVASEYYRFTITAKRLAGVGKLQIWVSGSVDWGTKFRDFNMTPINSDGDISDSVIFRANAGLIRVGLRNLSGTTKYRFIKIELVKVDSLFTDPKLAAPSNFVDSMSTLNVKSNNTVASNFIVTAGTDLPLRPTKVVRGDNIPIILNDREKSTFYSAGALAHGHSEKDGVVEVIAMTGGTTSTLNKMHMPGVGESNVVDGTVTWQYKGMYEKYAGIFNPASENLIVSSNDFSHSSYAKTNSITLHKICRGIISSQSAANPYGSSNSTALIDTNNQANDITTQIAIPTTEEYYCASIFIKKDASPTFPSFSLQARKNSVVIAESRIQLNKSQGSLYFIQDAAPMENYGLVDYPEWYRIYITFKNTTQCNLLYIRIKPAETHISGSIYLTSQGMAIIDQLQVEPGMIYPTAPIVTNGTKLQRDAPSWTLPISDYYSNLEGTIWAVFSAGPIKTGFSAQGVVSINDDVESALFISDARKVSATDGTITSQSSDFDEHNEMSACIRWDIATAKYQMIVGGVAEPEVTFDGSFDISVTLSLFLNSVSIKKLTHIKMYTEDIGVAECIAITANNA